MMQASLSASPTCKGRLKSHHLLTTKICSFESISAFRGGAEEAAAPLFFLVFSKRFCTTPKPSNRSSSVVIIVQSGCSEVFLRGGGWGTRPLLSEFSADPPLKRVMALEGVMKLKGLSLIKNISRIACRAKRSLQAEVKR